MDDVDEALGRLFYALLKADPKSQGITWRQINEPWEQMPRRKRIIAIITVLLNQLDVDA